MVKMGKHISKIYLFEKQLLSVKSRDTFVANIWSFSDNITDEAGAKDRN